jgi:hypothetical protein
MKAILKAVSSAALILGFVANTQAATIFSTDSLTGDVAVSGYASTLVNPDPTTGSFTIEYTNLVGDVDFFSLAAGNYNVSVAGDYELTGFGPSPISGSLASTSIYSGDLGSDIPVGPYSWSFGVPSPAIFNFDLEFDYDGDASSAIMSLLSGFGFVNPDGAGTINASVSLSANSATFLVSESNLTWTGFARTFALADAAYSQSQAANNPDRIDGSFALTNASVTAVNSPATIGLFGLAMFGLVAARRRTQA